MAHPIDFHFPHNSGDSLSEKLTLPRVLLSDNEHVEPIREGQRSYNGLGRIIGIKTTTDVTVGSGKDTYHYNIVRLEPTDECAPVDHTVDIASAFVSRHDSGIFYGIGMTAMKAGFTATMFSHEKGASPLPSVTALNHLAIGDSLENDEDYDQPAARERDIIAVSESLVVAVKRLEIMHQLNRGPAYINGRATVAHTPVSPAKKLGIIAQFPKDVLHDVVYSIVNDPRQIGELAGTPHAPWDIGAMRHALTSIIPLLNARVGTSLAKVHPLTHGHIRIFGNDPFGEHDAHYASWSRHTLVNAEIVPDARHAHFMRPSEQRVQAEQIRARAAELRSHTPSPSHPISPLAA